MKRNGIYFLLIVSLLLSLIGCSNSTTAISSAPNTTREKNFNIIFKYGVFAGNILDTFQNTFTKDMVEDSPITVALSLSQEDMDVIYQKMVEINFFDFPTDFNDRIPPNQVTTTIVTPGDIYYFNVQIGQNTKEVYWDAGRVYNDEQASDFESLIRLIIEIIQTKDEYKQIPEPTSGYL